MVCDFYLINFAIEKKRMTYAWLSDHLEKRNRVRHTRTDAVLVNQFSSIWVDELYR